MKFIKYDGSNDNVEKGKIYQVARRTLKGDYILKGIEGRFPKEDCISVAVHEGTTIYRPKVGESFSCACYEKRQKIEYQTSPVTAIFKKEHKRYIVYTKNSVYIVFVLLDD